MYQEKLAYECFRCRFNTGTHKELYEHNSRLHPNSELSCSMCMISFNSFCDFASHLCPGQPKRNTILDIAFRCVICNMAPIQSSFWLSYHYEHLHSTCPICIEACPDVQVLQKHSQSHYGPPAPQGPGTEFVVPEKAMQRRQAETSPHSSGSSKRIRLSEHDFEMDARDGGDTRMNLASTGISNRPKSYQEAQGKLLDYARKTEHDASNGGDTSRTEAQANSSRQPDQAFEVHFFFLFLL